MTTMRYMKTNDSSATPTRLVCVDTETLGMPVDSAGSMQRHHLRCGFATYDEVSRGRSMKSDAIRFTEIATFWNWLSGKLKRKQNVWVVAHKASFDLQVLGFFNRIEQGLLRPQVPSQVLPEADATGDKLTKGGRWVMSDPPLILGCVDKHGRPMTMLDSMNWFKMSLADLGESIGMEKLPMPEDDAPREEWDLYCMNDVTILRRAMIGIMDKVVKNDYGLFRMTIAGQAMAAFRHRFMERNSIVFHECPAARCLERHCYYGGRVDPFFIGSRFGKFFQVDVRSLYPYVMRNTRVPVKLLRSDLGKRFDVTHPGFNDENTAAIVQLESPDRAYPRRVGESSIYARGRFTTALAGPELAEAVRSGHVLRYGPWATYQTANLFQGYVDHFYRGKLAASREGNKADYLFNKLMLNSLYGKFGQRSNHWEHVHKPHCFGQFCKFHAVDPTSERLVEYLDVGGFVFRRLPHDLRCETFDPMAVENVAVHWRRSGEKQTSFPAISAWITSAARLFMDSLRETSGRFNTFYQSTDSLIVNEAGYENLIESNRLTGHGLGSLKLEARGDSITIYGCHDYAIGRKAVMGFRQLDAYQIGRGVFRQTRFTRFTEAASHRPAPVIFSTTHDVSRKTSHVRSKVEPSGFTTPVELFESTDQYNWPFGGFAEPEANRKSRHRSLAAGTGCPRS